MAKKFDECPPDVVRMLLQVVSRHHPDLAAAEVSFRLFFVQGEKNKFGEEKAPPIKVNGIPHFAKVRVNKTVDRAQGLPDVTVFLHLARWEEWNFDRRLAALHKIIAGLVVEEDVLAQFSMPEGEKVKVFKSDSRGRAILKKRPPDFHLSGYYEVIEEHKENSVDYESAQDFTRQYQQLLMPFASEVHGMNPSRN